MEEINLYKLLGFYVRNWLLILSITLAGLMAGLVYNQFIQTPMYKSNATLLLIKSTGSSQDTTLLNNYVQLFQSRRVLEPVIGEQQLGVTFDEFKGNVSAVNDKNTEVIRLSVSTSNPEKSKKFLEAAVVNFKTEAKELYGSDNLTVVDNASDAVPPYNVNKTLQLAIASGAGFVVSLLVLFFIYDARGGKVDDWGKKKSRATKAKSVPRTKANTSRPQSAGTTSAIGRAWQRFTTSAKNGLWIEESKAETPSRDTTKD